jgi:hypothetical protein
MTCAIPYCRESGVTELQGVDGFRWWCCAGHVDEYIAKGYKPVRSAP